MGTPTTVYLGQWIAIANASKYFAGDGSGDRGDLVAVYETEVEARAAEERGWPGYARGTVIVRQIGKRGVRTPRGTELEDGMLSIEAIHARVQGWPQRILMANFWAEAAGGDRVPMTRLDVDRICELLSQ